MPVKPSRAERFRVIRDAIMAHGSRIRLREASTREMSCGPFYIVYTFPGAFGSGRGHNLQIWPGRRVDSGHMIGEDKVANVDWNDRDEVDILSFRSGTWEEELLSLLKNESNISFFG